MKSRCLLVSLVLAVAHVSEARSGVLQADVESVNFGMVWIGNTGYENLTVLNTGTQGGEMLELSNIEIVSTSSAFWMASGTDTCEVGQLIGECDVWLRFDPDTVGTVRGNLVIETTDGQSVTIRVAGTSEMPPVPELTATEFSFEVALGDSASQALTIHNAGVASLSWGFYPIIFCITNPWVRVSPSSGLTQGGETDEVEVQVNISDTFLPGSYETPLCFNWRSGENIITSVEIPVTLVVTERPLFSDRFEQPEENL